MLCLCAEGFQNAVAPQPVTTIVPVIADDVFDSRKQATSSCFSAIIAGQKDKTVSLCIKIRRIGEVSSGRAAI